MFPYLIDLRSGLMIVVLFCFKFHAKGNVCPSSIHAVHECPTSHLEYETNSKRLDCLGKCGSEYYYHCLRDHEMENRFELCALNIKITGHCPEYSVGGQLIQNDHNAPYDYPCDGQSKCPVYINSTDAYKYPYCLKIHHPSNPHVPQTEGPFHPRKIPPQRENRPPPFRENRFPTHKENPSLHQTNDESSSLPIIVIGVIFGIVALILITIVFYEKHTNQTSWTEALRRVVYCILSCLPHNRNDDENVVNVRLTTDSS